MSGLNGGENGMGGVSGGGGASAAHGPSGVSGAADAKRASSTGGATRSGATRASSTGGSTRSGATRASGAKHLLIGLDGAGLDIVRAFGADALPNLHRCLARGAYSALQSVQPPATLPNWTTLLTGDNPGTHGVFDFTTRDGYRVKFTAGSVRETPTLAARLDRVGLRCACLFFPGTFPPERLQHGVFVSGWDSPVAFEADRSFVWPPSAYDAIVSRFGVQRFDDVDEFDADSDGFHARLPDSLCARVARRAELGAWMLEEQAFDLFAIYFGESDTAAHHLWSLHDPSSPRRPARVSERDRDGLRRVYSALDAAVGKLLAAAGGDAVELTVVSDHGSGGSSDRVLYLNRALALGGFLKFRPRRIAAGAVARAKDLALTQLPPAVREKLFRGFGAVLPGLVESRARFAVIDMQRTTVFSDELNYFPALHYNLDGREPLGTLAAGERARVLRELRAFFDTFCDPWTGERVVKQVWQREELFHGSALYRAPDLLLELAMPDGYSYNLMPSAAAPGNGAFRRLRPDEHLGRKGRSLAGSHRPRGLFIGCGPRVRELGEIDAAMADVSATLLARMEMSQLHRCDGRVLGEMLVGGDGVQDTPLTDTPLTDTPLTDTPLTDTPLTDTPLTDTPLTDTPLTDTPLTGAPESSASRSSTPRPDAPHPNAGSGAAEARVEARLRRLGYIE